MNHFLQLPILFAVLETISMKCSCSNIIFLIFKKKQPISYQMKRQRQLISYHIKRPRQDQSHQRRNQYILAWASKKRFLQLLIEEKQICVAKGPFLDDVKHILPKIKPYLLLIFPTGCFTAMKIPLIVERLAPGGRG